MTVSAEYEADIQTVYDILIDPQYLVDRNIALGELSAECEAEEYEDFIRVTYVREIQRELPALLAKIFDPISIMDMEEDWREDGDGWSGDWTMRVRKQPVTIFGRFELVPTATGCRYSVTHSADVKIPLVGGQVKKFVLEQTRQGAEDELAYLGTYLEQN